MTRASFYDLYEGLRDLVRRFTSYSASLDVVVSPGHRSLVEQDEQVGTDARRGERSTSLGSSQSVTAGSHTLSSTSRPSPIVRSPTPHTPNQPVLRVLQPPQAPRAPPRAPRNARILMPPLAPLNLDASNATNHGAATSDRPDLRNLPPLDFAYEYAKRGGAGPLQRPHAARPSPMGLTRTGTLIIGDPDYIGPLHEMRSVHAVGRRHALRADGEGNVPSGRGNERTRTEAPTPSIPNHGAFSSPDIRQISRPAEQSFPLPLLLELLHVQMLEIDVSFEPANQCQSNKLLYQIQGTQEPHRRLHFKISSRSGRSQPPGPARDFRCCLNTVVPQSAKIAKLIGSFTSPAGAAASSGPTSGWAVADQPSETCSRIDSTSLNTASVSADRTDLAPDPSQDRATRSCALTIYSIRSPRRREPSTESQWSSAAVARGGTSQPLIRFLSPQWGMRAITPRGREGRRTLTTLEQATRGLRLLPDGGFGSRRGSDRNLDDGSISPPRSEFGNRYGLPLDIGAGVLGSPFTSGSSAGSSAAKRSREVEEPRASREESDFGEHDSELYSSPASTVYGVGQSSRSSSRDRSGRMRTRRNRCHSDPENNTREERSGGDGPPRKRHRSY
ncbi:hypothetical protein BS47DRAFT_1366483 [Hydnum rufescens UP504]|uniref:Uncharacterized protein n=1 Tax=Hydnum rufescens UP504 TaxID=1448309 RepID=A0A9P6AKZ6_9AGAM|nr:hypothetical protein BS47DRAFT_1366483 [Hydnum rufescens UP504]